MEASTGRFYSFRIRVISNLVALSVIAITSACATLPPSSGENRTSSPISEVKSEGVPSPVPETSQPEVAGPPEPYGPPVPESPLQPTEPTQPKPLVLVLGPGKARAFAHVGVIRALVQAKIPIGAILGTEMGALLGALYAMEGKVNRFEWAMLKFNDNLFVNPKSLMPTVFQKTSKTRALTAALQQVFGQKDLSQAVIPLRLALLSKDSGVVQVVGQGPSAPAVKAAVSDPDLYEAGEWNGAPAISAAALRPYLVAEAKELNLGPVVVVDPLDESEARTVAGAQELKDADLVLRPDLNGIGNLDFSKRMEAAFRGRSVVESHMDELKNLAGLPRESESQKGRAP